MLNIEDKDTDIKLPPEEVDALINKIEETGHASKEMLLSLEARFPDYKAEPKLLNSLTGKPSKLNADRLKEYLYSLRDESSKLKYIDILEMLDTLIKDLINIDNLNLALRRLKEERGIVSKLYVPKEVNELMNTSYTSLGEIPVPDLIRNESIYNRYKDHSLLPGYFYNLKLNIVPFVLKEFFSDFIDYSFLTLEYKRVYTDKPLSLYIVDNIELINLILKERERALDVLNVLKLNYLENDIKEYHDYPKLIKLLKVIRSECIFYLFDK